MAEYAPIFDALSSTDPPVSDPTLAELVPRELPLHEVSDGDSPRQHGLNMDHVRSLAEIGERLPPIAVHAQTSRVIDGAHRLHAARLRGDTTISAVMFHGTEQAAFVLAVEANTSHGLPLSLADRREAATRIFTMFPQWSDRRLASVCGLSASTIADLRRRLGTDADNSEPRVGKDGKVRPMDVGARRLMAVELFKSNPTASLRQVAAEAGVSVGTARDVKLRLQRGAPPVPQPIRKTMASEGSDQDAMPRTPAIDGSERERLMGKILRDPSVRRTDAGRHLLHWLRGRRSSGVDGWEEALSGLEPHSDFSLAKLARTISAEWATLASLVEERSRNRRGEA